MRVLLLRHALAEDREEWAESSNDDALRPLTDKGRRRMKKQAAALRLVLDSLDVILAAPVKRAEDTAKILQKTFDEASLATDVLLSPGVEARKILARLRDFPDDCTVALVGCEPDLSRLLGMMLAGKEASFVNLRKGSACLVEFCSEPAAGKGVMEWLLPQHVLREVASCC